MADLGARSANRPALAATGLALLLLLCFLRPMWEIDLFWHIEVGRWIVDHRALPDRDIFSYVDPSRPWHTFQWLYEVLCWLGERAVGLHAVQWAHHAVMALALGWLCWLVGRRAGVAAGVLAAGCLLIGFGDRVRERPDVFNLLFTVSILPWMVRREPLGRTRLVALAVLGALWASLHAGGALLLPTLLGARAAARFAGGRWSGAALREAIVEVTPALGLLVSPGYVTGVRHAFGMIDAAPGFIPEWATAWQYLLGDNTSVYGKLTALGLVGWPLLAFALARRHPTALGQALLPALLVLPLLVLGARHMRFLWLPSLAPAVALLWLPPADDHAAAGRRWPVWAAALALAVGLHHQVWTLSGGPAQAARQALIALEPGAFPVAAARLLRTCGQAGATVFNHAPWGGYLLHALSPDARVFSDSRGNFSVSEAAVLADLNRVSTRRPALERAFAAAPFQWLVHPAPFPLADQDRAKWVLVAKDPDAEVWLPLHAPGGAARADTLRSCLGLPAASSQTAALATAAETVGARRIAASASLSARQSQWQAAAAAGVGPQAVQAARQLLGLWFNHGVLGRCARPAFAAQVEADAGVQYWRALCAAVHAGPATAQPAIQRALALPDAELGAAGISAPLRARLTRLARPQVGEQPDAQPRPAK